MLITTTAPFHFTLPRYQGVWFWFWLNTLIKSSLLAVVPCLISCVWSWLQGQNSVCPPSNFTFAQIMPPYIHCLALISQVLDPHFREHTMLKSSLLSIFPFPYFRVHNRVVIKGRVQKKIKNNYGKFHIGSWPPPSPPFMEKFFSFFSETRPFLRTFCKKCIFTIENPKKT